MENKIKILFTNTTNGETWAYDCSLNMTLGGIKELKQSFATNEGIEMKDVHAMFVVVFNV